jgi:hypothetical protein
VKSGGGGGSGGTYLSSIFSISFHISTCLSSMLSISYHSSTYFSSIFSEVLTVMISPLCTNCHDITVILLNVALNDRENTDENSEKIRKIWKKSKLNSEML